MYSIEKILLRLEKNFLEFMPKVEMIVRLVSFDSHVAHVALNIIMKGDWAIFVPSNMAVK